jgi:hypothetical protein
LENGLFLADRITNGKKEFASGSASTLNNMALSKDGAFATPESMAAWELIIFDHDD